jgi:hypothetical protein
MDENENQYLEFRKQYEIQHPASIPILELEGIPYPRWLKFTTLLMFLAAALMSAVHTIPVVYAGIPEDPVISSEIRTLAANVSILAFELGILLSAFLMMTKSSMALAWVLLGTMFAGTLVSNIYSISQTSTSDWGAGIVTIIFGAGIPIIALAAGKLFVNIYNAEFNAGKRANAAYREACIAWDKEIAKAFEKWQKSGNSGKRVERVSGRGRGKSLEISSGKYQSNATEIVTEYLKENPDAFQRSNRDLASELGVSHPIVGKVKNELSNGNNHHD